MANRVTQQATEAVQKPSTQATRVTQQATEAVQLPSTAKARTTQLAAQAVLLPNTQQALVTSLCVEVVQSSIIGVGTPGGTNPTPDIWEVMIEQGTSIFISHGGQRSILIRLIPGATIPSDGVWKEGRVYSSLMPVLAGDFISYGGYMRNDFNAPVPTGVQIIQRIGLLFYDANFTLLSEIYRDAFMHVPQTPNPQAKWVRWVPPRPAAVPAQAAYVRMEVAGFINNSSGSVFVTPGLCADLRFDDLWAIQQTDPSNTVIPKGSLPPSYVPPFKYTANSNSITWSWTNFNIFRADGGLQPIPNGTITVGGLNAATTYYFFPYWDEDAQALSWLHGLHGAAPNNIAYLAGELDFTHNQQQNLLNRVALSQTAMPAATTASGTGGGFGGGSGRCHRKGTKVLTKTRGVKNIEDTLVGEWIMGRNDWTQIVDKNIAPHETFIRVELETGDAIEVTPSHPFTLSADEGDESKRASQLCAEDVMFIRTGVAYIRSISVVKYSDGEKVSLSCLPEHEFYAGEEEPNILSHNIFMVS